MPVATSLLLLSLFLTSCENLKTIDVNDCQNCDLWGGDNRQEAYQATSPTMQKAVNATGLIYYSLEKPDRTDEGNMVFEFGKTLEQQYHFPEGKLCQDERFKDQQRLKTTCGGTLVAPNLFLTAAHCVNADIQSIHSNDPQVKCQAIHVAFGYHKNKDDDLQPTIPGKDFYSCEEITILKRDDDNADVTSDLALIKLNRPVDDREYLDISFNTPAPYQERSALGFPLGLPMKISFGEVVSSLHTQNFLDLNNAAHWRSQEQIVFYDNSYADFIKVITDAFSGNSGGPLINSAGELEGVFSSTSLKLIYDHKNPEENGYRHSYFPPEINDIAFYPKKEENGCFASISCDGNEIAGIAGDTGKIVCLLHPVFESLAPYRLQLEALGITENKTD